MQRIRQYISNLNPATIIWSLVIVGLVFGLASFGLTIWVASTPVVNWWGSFLQNLSAGMFGSAVTFWLIDVVFGGRKEREAKVKALAERKRQIIEQMNSPVNDAALEAVRLAKLERWDSDGSLRGANLTGANLQGADLGLANLHGASLNGTNLQGVDLFGTNLEGAHLISANLKAANLIGVNLQWANLTRANLREAYLMETNLQGAHLGEANLQEADLEKADLTGTRLDKRTTLPDGTKWTPDTDMSRFTDPNHPNFWRSDD